MDSVWQLYKNMYVIHQNQQSVILMVYEKLLLGFIKWRVFDHIL